MTINSFLESLDYSIFVFFRPISIARSTIGMRFILFDVDTEKNFFSFQIITILHNPSEMKLKFMRSSKIRFVPSSYYEEKNGQNKNLITSVSLFYDSFRKLVSACNISLYGDDIKYKSDFWPTSNNTEKIEFVSQVSQIFGPWTFGLWMVKNAWNALSV